MRLRQIFDILRDTELKQIIVGEDDQAIITYLNLALIEVYGKFNILQEEQIINTVVGQTRYRLQENSQRVLQVYFRDLTEVTASGDDGFLEVPINDINCELSVFTPEPYVLHIPNAYNQCIYSVMHTVVPPYITKDNIDTIDLIVPPQFLEPLLSYAAYRAYKSMNGDEQTEIGTHMKSYMMSCKEVYKKGMINYSMLTNVKLSDRGYA